MKTPRPGRERGDRRPADHSPFPKSKPPSAAQARMATAFSIVACPRCGRFTPVAERCRHCRRRL